MTIDQKLEIINDFLEVNLIQDNKMREFTIKGLLLAKDIFYHMPASSSGKYHPLTSLGPGGLLRHTKAVVLICNSLFDLYNFTDYQKDTILSAAYLHDIEKPSKTHPLEVKLTLECLESDYFEEFHHVIPIIESHMGRFDLDGKLPRPNTNLKKFLHLCDFISSRKIINVDLIERGN